MWNQLCHWHWGYCGKATESFSSATCKDAQLLPLTCQAPWSPRHSPLPAAQASNSSSKPTVPSEHLQLAPSPFLLSSKEILAFLVVFWFDSWSFSFYPTLAAIPSLVLGNFKCLPWMLLHQFPRLKPYYLWGAQNLGSLCKFPGTWS